MALKKDRLKITDELRVRRTDAGRRADAQRVRGSASVEVAGTAC
jgi:hypothetical protein